MSNKIKEALARAAINAIKELLNVASPSKQLNKYAEQILPWFYEGVAKGLADMGYVEEDPELDDKFWALVDKMSGIVLALVETKRFNKITINEHHEGAQPMTRNYYIIAGNRKPLK